ncbi:MAG: hypothetical protein KBS65_03430 [Prevotella sp.]|nr:hypothetical protein [Candidatus Equicola stercoris]
MNIEIFMELMMVLFTLCEIPLAYKLPDLNKTLTGKNLKIVQSVLLAVPVVANVICYLVFNHNPSFFYLAAITVLSMIYILTVKK